MRTKCDDVVTSQPLELRIAEAAENDWWPRIVGTFRVEGATVATVLHVVVRPYRNNLWRVSPDCLNSVFAASKGHDSGYYTISGAKSFVGVLAVSIKKRINPHFTTARSYLTYASRYHDLLTFSFNLLSFNCVYSSVWYFVHATHRQNIPFIRHFFCTFSAFIFWALCSFVALTLCPKNWSWWFFCCFAFSFRHFRFRYGKIQDGRRPIDRQVAAICNATFLADGVQA